MANYLFYGIRKAQKLVESFDIKENLNKVQEYTADLYQSLQNTSVEVIEDLKKEEIICPDPDEIIQVYLNDYLTVSYNSIELFLSILLFIITVYSIIKALFKAKQSLSAEQIQKRIRIICWNTLANSFVQSLGSQMSISEDSRQHMIQQVIKNNPSDVLCLQEVDPFDTSFKNFLRKEGYQFLSVKRKKNPDRLVIAWNDNYWKYLNHTSIYFDQYQDQVETDKAALVIRLINRYNFRTFTIANAHLFHNPQFNDIKRLQVKILRSKVQQFKNPDDHVIICGDLNFKPDNECYDLMINSRNCDRMRDSYDNYCLKNSNVITNIKPEFKGRVDYIFLSESQLQVIENLPIPDMVKSRRMPPDNELPSDHVPVGVTIGYLI